MGLSEEAKKLGQEPAYPIGSGDMRDPMGMDIRTAAAIAVMQGLLSGSPGTEPATAAEYAVKHADALLEALTNKGSNTDGD